MSTAVGFVILVAASLLFDAYRVPSASMEPTVSIGDTVLVRAGSAPDRGDIVIAEPTTGGTRVIRRVVGLGGDVLSTDDGALIRNREPVDEDYLAQGVRTDLVGEVTVPDRTVFLLGDVRHNSEDSRRYGPVSIEHVHGVVVYNGVPIHRILLFGVLGLLAVALLLIARDTIRARRTQTDSQEPDAP